MVFKVNNSKKGLFIVMSLLVILISTLALGIFTDKMRNKKDSEDRNNYIETATKKEEEQKEEVKKEPEVQSTVQAEVVGLKDKLKGKKDVNVLILGDGLALSRGSTSADGLWDQGIANWIQTNYGAKAKVVSLAEDGAASGRGVQIVNNNNITGYDLVIVCYGQNDNNSAVNRNTFKTNYSTIIDKVKEANSKATIISILPNTLNLNNQYRDSIQNIATEKGVLVADMKKAFTASGSEASYVTGQLPNNYGYQVYTQTIGEVIKGQVN